MVTIFRRLPWIYQIGLIVALVAALVVLGFLALQQFQAGGGTPEQVDETVDVGGLAPFLPPEQPQGIHVTGVGELVRAPDLAIVVFGVTAEAPSAASAAASAEETASAVVEAIDDLEDLDFNDHDLQVGGVALTPTHPAGERRQARQPVTPLRRRSGSASPRSIARRTLSTRGSRPAPMRCTRTDLSPWSTRRRTAAAALRLAAINAGAKARAIAEALQGRSAGLINIEEKVTVIPLVSKGVDPALAKPADVAVHPGQVIIRAVVRANFAFE